MSDKKVASGLDSVLMGKLFNIGSLVATRECDTAELKIAVQAFIDGQPFKVELLKPSTFGGFLALSNPTQGVLNQLVSERRDWWQLLNEIEDACLLNGGATAKAKPFINGLWAGEVSGRESLKQQDGWQYLPVSEAIEAWKKVFGSSLKTDGLVDRVKTFKPWEHSEGIGVWPSLSFLANYFEITKVLGVSGEVIPTGTDLDSLASYAKIVECFLLELGVQYRKATGFPFHNWRSGQLSSRHIQLTAGGRQAWQTLEGMFAGSDLVAAPASSSVFAGHSDRRARLEIVLAEDFPQDLTQVAGTLMVGSGRLTKYEHLGMYCPGTQYSVEADGSFPNSLVFHCDGGVLYCYNIWAGLAYWGIGSPGVCLG